MNKKTEWVKITMESICCSPLSLVKAEKDGKDITNEMPLPKSDGYNITVGESVTILVNTEVVK